MTVPIRVLVVDDHTLFRRGITALLAGDPRFEVVAEAGDAGEAQRRAAETQPDVVLLDNHLPGVHGVQALAGLREVAPRAQVLMLTVSEDERDLAAALRGGARGYLLKTVDSDALASAIVRTVAGQSTISPEMTGKLVTAFQSLQPEPAAPAAPAPAPADPLASLSPREQQILAEIALGASNKEIARTLAIAETTVKIHVQHILRKLGLSSRVQAAVYATRGNGHGD
ncbi:response regulator [Rubrivivax sp. RP6-9]|uniref:response regulator n=1 Tax=Rubrivivax sp. RP6-9 TaxID=3415750 RepID=UPI003CC55763